MWGRHPPHTPSILCNQSNHRYVATFGICHPCPMDRHSLQIKIRSNLYESFNRIPLITTSLSRPPSPMHHHLYHRTDFSTYNWLWMQNKQWPWHNNQNRYDEQTNKQTRTRSTFRYFCSNYTLQIHYTRHGPDELLRRFNIVCVLFGGLRGVICYLLPLIHSRHSN